jgi:hypothetical protein
MDTKEYQSVDEASGELIKCYQIQIDRSGKPSPAYIGSFKDIPLVTHTTIVYDQKKDQLNIGEMTIDSISAKNTMNNKNRYNIHMVTYFLPEESIKNKIYKIVGLIVQKNNELESSHSLDLRYNTENDKFEFIYCDHRKDSVEVVEILDGYPGNDSILTELMEMMFKDPIKSIILA